jgi:hypothetical protein
MFMRGMSSRELTLGFVVGVLSGIVLAGYLVEGNVAYAQLGRDRNHGKAVHFLIRDNILSKDNQWIDPSFYVLHEDGTVVKKDRPDRE